MNGLQVWCLKFQSTLSVRRATPREPQPRETPQFQSTLSVRRATIGHGRGLARERISIHALREESDRVQALEEYIREFQSTLSVRRATVQLDISVRFLRRKPAA